MKREWMQKIQDSLCIVLNHLLFVAAAITGIVIKNISASKKMKGGEKE